MIAELPTPPVAPMRGVAGYLHLTCAVGANDKPYLARQQFRPPIHVSKTFIDDGVLAAQLMTPTAGLFADDRIEIDVRVEAGAKLLLITPAATRVHNTLGKFAKIDQHYSVADGAWFEYRPTLLIPQTGASFHQRTRIDVASGGELFYCEPVAPGRVANGEIFLFEKLQMDFELSVGGQRVIREKYVLSSDCAPVRLLQRLERPYFATCHIVSHRLRIEELHRAVHAIHSDGTWCGATGLGSGVFVVRFASRDSIALRKSVQALRNQLPLQALQAGSRSVDF